MEKNYKVSVIIPVYNVEKFVGRCAESVFSQTLKELEIIFIDDCSPDKSVDTIKATLEKFPDRINDTKIITMSNNGGPSAARKRGIELSSGQYITYLDSDDWIDKELYEAMYAEAKSEDADVVVCDMMIETSSGSTIIPVINLPSNGRELIKNLYKKDFGMFHNKMVKASLQKDRNLLPWENLDFGEDAGLFTRIFYYAEKIGQVKGPVYHYNKMNSEAITSTCNPNQARQMIEIARRLEKFFSEKPDGDEFQKTVDALKYRARFFMINNSYTEYFKFLKTFPESKKIVKELDISGFTKGMKLKYNFVKNGAGLLYIFLFKTKQLIKRIKI